MILFEIKINCEIAVVMTETAVWTRKSLSAAVITHVSKDSQLVFHCLFIHNRLASGNAKRLVSPRS